MDYQEIQPSYKNPIALLVIGPAIPICLIMGYACIQQIVFGIPFGSKPGPNWTLLVAFIIPLLIALFSLVLKLEINIYVSVLEIKFTPFNLFRRMISLDEIKQSKILKYDAISEHGGWGYRLTKDLRAYTLYGNYAVQLTTHNDKTILIGTQLPNELLSAINSNSTKEYNSL